MIIGGDLQVTSADGKMRAWWTSWIRRSELDSNATTSAYQEI